MMTKKGFAAALLFLILLITSTYLSSCASPAIKQKVGAQLWGENCVRCHNAPTPNAFDDKEWKAIGLHMKIRANLTKDELDKILEFLQMAN